MYGGLAVKVAYAITCRYDDGYRESNHTPYISYNHYVGKGIPAVREAFLLSPGPGMTGDNR